MLGTEWGILCAQSNTCRQRSAGGRPYRAERLFGLCFAGALAAEKKPAAQKPVKGFEQVVGGENGASVSTADAPAEIVLPKQLRLCWISAWRST